MVLSLGQCHVLVIFSSWHLQMAIFNLAEHFCIGNMVKHDIALIPPYSEALWGGGQCIFKIWNGQLYFKISNTSQNICSWSWTLEILQFLSSETDGQLGSQPWYQGVSG